MHYMDYERMPDNLTHTHTFLNNSLALVTELKANSVIHANIIRQK